MHVSVVISDALKNKCYYSNVTTKWWIYHHKKVVSIHTGTFPKELKIHAS